MDFGSKLPRPVRCYAFVGVARDAYSVSNPLLATCCCDARCPPAPQVAARFTAGPSRAYYVVPHKAAPGVDGPFVLRMFAGAAMELEQCASPMSLVLGEWLE